jgi:hypothetical protein
MFEWRKLTYDEILKAAHDVNELAKTRPDYDPKQGDRNTFIDGYVCEVIASCWTKHEVDIRPLAHGDPGWDCQHLVTMWGDLKDLQRYKIDFKKANKYNRWKQWLVKWKNYYKADIMVAVHIIDEQAVKGQLLGWIGSAEVRGYKCAQHKRNDKGELIGTYAYEVPFHKLRPMSELAELLSLPDLTEQDWILE